MGLPKRKISTRRKGKRQATFSINIPPLEKCQTCGKLKIVHQACRNCAKPVKQKKEEKK